MGGYFLSIEQMSIQRMSIEAYKSYRHLEIVPI